MIEPATDKYKMEIHALRETSEKFVLGNSPKVPLIPREMIPPKTSCQPRLE